MNRLHDKVALITGSSRGIGRGIALCLARDGADVVVTYRTHPEEGQDTLQEIEKLGRRAILLQTDAGDCAALEHLFATAVAHFGHVDIAVANASYGRSQAVIDTDLEHLQRTIDVALLGVFHTCRLAARQMVRQIEAGRRGGKILIIGSVQGEAVPPKTAPYSMSKAAINHLGRILALELAPHHINVNTINPGWIDTPGERSTFGDEMVSTGGKHVLWGRLGTPRDIASLAVYLSSDAGDYITGASLRVDGGFIIGMGRGTSFPQGNIPAGPSGDMCQSGISRRSTRASKTDDRSLRR